MGPSGKRWAGGSVSVAAMRIVPCDRGSVPVPALIQDARGQPEAAPEDIEPAGEQQQRRSGEDRGMGHGCEPEMVIWRLTISPGRRPAWRRANAMTMNTTAGIRPGMTGSETTRVTREVTVAHFHPEMPEVYGTPFMIYLMEVAASNAIQPFLPAGWVSVGADVSVRHLAATPVGQTVTARARVTAVNGRVIAFDVEAFDDVERIGEGTHLRAVIDRSRFERKLQDKRTAGG